MEKSIRLRVFAKANLSLDITGADEKSGLHTLDSVMVSLDAFDTVTVSPRTDKDVRVKFVNADIGEDNTALKAAQAIMRELDCPGMDIEIEKGIPVGAGLGGSSADGAAVIRAFDLYYGLSAKGIDARKAALSVGSDVPFMLTGGLARVRGTGADMFFMENKLPLFAVGLMSASVSTAQAYRLFDELYPSRSFSPSDTESMCDRLLGGEKNALDFLGNALYEPACLLCPAIKENAAKLEALGAAVNMTGSGGMVLGYFTDIERFARCAAALKTEPGFRVFTTAKTGILHEWIDRG